MKLTSVLRRSLLLTPVLAALMLASCGEDLGNLVGTAGEPGTLERVYSYSEVQGCGTCHSPDGQAMEGPDLSSASAFRSSLVNKTYDDYVDWFDVTAQCSEAGFPYITPGEPNNSALLASIVWSYGEAKCEGSHAYHDTQKAIIDDNQELIDDLVLWIENGANP